jgi:hypothetical protein
VGAKGTGCYVRAVGRPGPGWIEVGEVDEKITRAGGEIV